MASKKNTDPRRGRKNMRFEKLHPGMTRTEWAKYKKSNNLPKIITKNVR